MPDAVAAFSQRALALQPDQIALLVNSNVPEGMELAKFYADQRHIPPNRILVLDLPKAEHMTNRQYADQVVPQVREFLHTGQLEEKITCFVTFYGVPLGIDARVNNAEEGDEQTDIRHQLISLPDQIRPAIEAVEAMAMKLNADFSPEKLSDLDHLVRRRSAAFREVSTQLNSIPDKKRQAELASQFFDAADVLMGEKARIDKASLVLVAGGTTKPDDDKALTDMQQHYIAMLHEAATLEAQPNDPKARQRLRDIAQGSFGLMQYMKLLRDQLDYLDTTSNGIGSTGAAFDNELAMVEWNVYPRRGFTPNPLNHLANYTGPFRTLMVTRLDAPQPETVKAMITNSIKTEAQGLRGQVVIDSQGIHVGDEKPGQSGFSVYDQYLRDLARVLTDHSKMKVTLDEKPEVLPAGSETDVALYVGWYSLRNYIPCCKFNAGAIGYHIASYELASLHQPGESGWVHGLINDGVVGTLGPVAEPYLGTFPRPDEFFPLLLTGKLTLAEVYWKTEPTVSWMQCCIGDPLYNPYKNNPQLSDIDLPLQLRQVLRTEAPVSK